MTGRGPIALLLVLLTAFAGAVPAQAQGDVRAEELTVAGTPEPDGAPVDLDATLHLPPTDTPAPAVLLAHGFGGSKGSVASFARTLAEEGYVVLSWSARGFGRSGGLIHLDATDYEVADASLLLDALAQRPEVALDADGDPRVAVAGASYGGALALLLAGTDRRVDALVPMITWNDLSQSLFPQHRVSDEAPATPAAVDPVEDAGVFKRLWAGQFFGSGSTARDGETPSTCGRFAPDVCAAYQEVAEDDGLATPRIRELLLESSPATVLDRVEAPTLLIQGQSDSLFPLSEADANAAGIAANGTPVKVVWAQGGHDAGFDPNDERLRATVLDWLTVHLRGEGEADTRFEATVPRTVRTRGDRDAGPRLQTAPGLPGSVEDLPVPTRELALTGDAQEVVSPAGGNPAAVSNVPGLGAIASALGALDGTGLDTAAVTAPAGQSASFETAPLTEAVRIVGAPRVRLTVASTARDATLFAAVQDVTPDGRASLPQRLVAPVRVVGLAPGGREVEISLPAFVRDVPAGHRLRVTVASTDYAYALPQDARVYTVALAGDSTLLVPTAVPEASGGAAETTGVGTNVTVVAGAAAVVLALLVTGLVLAGRSRRRTEDVDPALADVPLAVVGLGKAYGDGFRAVSDLSFQVETGQVLGLLGPNGAGKTTTLRMLLGLIRPTEGSLRVFGHRVRAGAPVLGRVGALVEGPGFLPHLSGLANLEAFWAATGRPPDEARMEVALEIAGLGDDIHRRVRTYSHGMKQRLAIAQAMLGLPDLLVLDEPTNGLDPPQIREMREVLRAYAATGRTVVVSSHLLAEVEATCSHVVVMHQGRLVAEGEVAALVGTATVLVVDVDDPVQAAAVAEQVDGARDVQVTDTGLVLRLVGTPRGDLVRALVDAGLSVERVTPQHGLEEAFLSLVGAPGTGAEREA